MVWSMSSRPGCAVTFAVMLSLSRLSQGTTGRCSPASRAFLIRSTSLLFSLIAITSPTRTADELAGVTPRGGEADAVDDVVEPRLQQAEQVEAGDAGHLRGPVEVEPELALEQEVDAARALLGAQLDPVVGHLAAADLGVHAGRHRATVEGALGEALLSLEEELHALAAAVPADRTFVAGHLDAPPHPRAAAA